MDRSKLVIPEEMIRLYELQSGLKFATSNIPKKGPYLTTANTVRSFVHVGKFPIWYSLKGVKVTVLLLNAICLCMCVCK